MVSIVILTKVIIVPIKKLVTLVHTVPMVIMHTMLNLVTIAVLNVHWTSYNLTDILFLFNRKGMYGQMI